MAAAGPREIASPLYEGRVILENHLSALCLLISPGPMLEITTYFLGRGPAVAFGKREVDLGIWNAVYALDLSASFRCGTRFGINRKRVCIFIIDFIFDYVCARPFVNFIVDVDVSVTLSC